MSLPVITSELSLSVFTIRASLLSVDDMNLFTIRASLLSVDDMNLSYIVSWILRLPGALGCLSYHVDIAQFHIGNYHWQFFMPITFVLGIVIIKSVFVLGIVIVKSVFVVGIVIIKSICNIFWFAIFGSVYFSYLNFFSFIQGCSLFRSWRRDRLFRSYKRFGWRWY